MSLALTSSSMRATVRKGRGCARKSSTSLVLCMFSTTWILPSRSTLLRVGARIICGSTKFRNLILSVLHGWPYPAEARVRFRRSARQTALWLRGPRRLPASSAACRSTNRQFVPAGSLYPQEWNWPTNVKRFEHVAPHEHAALYSSSRVTLNITRQEMAESGYCPSGRFFEAAACGTPILTDSWEGLDTFFNLKDELCVVSNAEEVLSSVSLSDGELAAIAARARSRTLAEHTGDRRAEQLLAYCDEAYRRKYSASEVMA